jgi:hypothetical protein
MVLKALETSMLLLMAMVMVLKVVQIKYTCRKTPRKKKRRERIGGPRVV